MHSLILGALLDTCCVASSPVTTTPPRETVASPCGTRLADAWRCEGLREEQGREGVGRAAVTYDEGSIVSSRL